MRSVVCNGMGALLHSGTHQADAAAGLAGDAELEWASGWADVAPDLPPDQWPQRDPVGGGYAQLANGVHLLFDGRAPGPRVFQVNGTQGTVYLYNDLRQVQFWRRAAEPGVGDLVAGPMQAPTQQKS